MTFLLLTYILANNTAHTIYTYINVLTLCLLLIRIGRLFSGNIIWGVPVHTHYDRR